MKYNDDQLFYAALYWAEALPGGAAFTDDICAKHGKPYLPMNPPQQTVEEIDRDDFSKPFEAYAKIEAIVEAGVTRKQCEDFFDAMYSVLKAGEEKDHFTSSGKGDKFLELGRRASTSFSYFPFSDSIEYALFASGLEREIFPKRARVYIHDNGQLFASKAGEDSYPCDVAYPGRPDTGYRCIPKMTDKDLKDAPSVIMEYTYRMVELEVGKEYTSYYMSVAKTRCEFKYTAEEGDIFLLRPSPDYDFRTVSDEEIIKGEVINAGIPLNKRDLAEGHKIDADNPNIIRESYTWLHCAEVTEKIQIHCGSSFQTAEPGDKLMVEKEGYWPRVITKKNIDESEIRIIPVEEPKRGGKSKPKPGL